MTVGRMVRKFKLDKSEIKDLIDIPGYCIASDEVTVIGKKVGYMHAEKPKNDQDSGWSFFSGTESQEFADNPDNFSIYSLNTIANYDPDIIPFLHSVWGKAFAKDPSGDFVEETLVGLD